jgi:hypothetical protein
MSLNDQVLNAFATNLVNCVRERAKGRDDKSARIVNTRPDEFVLAGFLTPRSVGTGAAHDEDDAATDLPQDSAYEQTAIGLEWMVDAQRFSEISSIEVDVSAYVYVRVLPTFDEQRAFGSWQVERPSPAGVAGQRRQAAVPVWIRLSIPEFRIPVPGSTLLANRKVVIKLDGRFAPSLSGTELASVYPTRRPIYFSEEDLKDGPAFEACLRQLASKSFSPLWSGALDVRLISVMTEPTRHRIALRLVNTTAPAGPVQADFIDPNLYGIGMEVSLPSAAHREMVFQELPASFRYDRNMVGVGINSHVESTSTGGLLTMTVDSVPLTVVPRLEAREIPEADPTFAALEKDPVPILRTLVKAMRRYDSDYWEPKVASLTGVERSEAQDAREQFDREIARFERGIDVLEDPKYESVLRAFRLVNASMATASTHKRWRLFQIVFIVSVLPELAGRQFPELSRPSDNVVDLLWFAAGGGKTEAFLGVILWQAFFDRLRGKRLGTTAFVRYPLRLLTFQQLQRLGRAMASAELIRKAQGIKGARFSIGYLVGGGVTPNAINNELHARFEKHGVEPRLKRVFKCPFCSADVNLTYASQSRLIEHRCSSSQCPGGTQRLPIYVTDQDVYRYLPTVIVSTVDKLAFLGQNQRFLNLMGRFDLVCGTHGATFGNNNKLVCEAAEALGRGEKPVSCRGERLELGPFHDPSPALLIQDELHLLSEELGTFDSHYETGAMELARSIGSMPWKIIGATATIQDFRRHAWELYLRDARQFPAPGPEAYESFYYRQSPEKIGRIFVGILGVGRKHTPAVTKTLSIFYQEVQIARDLFRDDPQRAGNRYGTGSLSSDDVRELLFLYELALTYVLTRKGSDQVAEAIESRVRKELQELSPAHGELIVDMFNGGVDVGQMITAMEELKTSSPEGDPSTRTRGIVTTNIIGHGVDVDRFNVIVFAGFTRLVAEYIQASARVGRTFPGLSVFVATPQSERDRSIFDRFAKFHQYLDRLVDPAAVTRWPEPALERTVPGILCGYLMGPAAKAIGKPISTVEHVQDAYAAFVGDVLSADTIVDWMARAYGCGDAPSPDRYRNRLSLRTRNAFSSIVNAIRRRGSQPQALNIHLGAMNSLRDVDDAAEITAATKEEARALRRFIKG